MTSVKFAQKHAFGGWPHAVFMADLDLLLLTAKERYAKMLDDLDATCDGLALGAFQKKLIFLIGNQRSVFHYLVDRVFPSWPALLNHMETSHGTTQPVSKA